MTTLHDLNTTTLDDLNTSAEAEWLERWTAGPVEPEGHGLAQGAAAPDLVLPDETGADRRLSEFWDGHPALVMFWRHFGCNCGAERARRLVEEYAAYREAGLVPVIIAQGEPARAAAYRELHRLPCPVLSDPEHAAYRAFGIGQWTPERVLYDAPEAFLHMITTSERSSRPIGKLGAGRRWTTPGARSGSSSSDPTGGCGCRISTSTARTFPNRTS